MKIVAANCISNFYPQNKEYVPGVCLLLLSFALLAVVAQPLHCRDGVSEACLVWGSSQSPHQGGLVWDQVGRELLEAESLLPWLSSTQTSLHGSL